jgi:demethylmenaquinone methyltransferase/2-methoxy-6-polyprenyl-1,4-benzoquinol methylase
MRIPPPEPAPKTPLHYGSRRRSRKASPHVCYDARMSETTAKPGTTHFGYRDVPEADKARLVGKVFTSVARNYDIMNDLMSFGVHRLWKRYFVATSGVREGDRVLDLAGGTGDIAALLLPKVGAGGSVVVGDINGDMLRVGRDRLIDRGQMRGLDWSQMDAEALPFPDKSFDCVTMAFGLRNVTRKENALAEIHRVLKIGGRALVLEFSSVRAQFLKPLYDFHSFEVLPRIGKLIAGDEASYRYLAESIRKHPDQETLKAMMESAGLERVDVRNLSAGIVAIHRGYRV